MSHRVVTVGQVAPSEGLAFIRSKCRAQCHRDRANRHARWPRGIDQNGDVKEARIHQLESEVAMLREERRINGARMQRIDPHRRPQYTAVERLAILELRAMRGWNKAETDRRFYSLPERQVRCSPSVSKRRRRAQISRRR